MSVEPGRMAPDFTALADDGVEMTLSELRGKKVVLYFYPKADTPGCTREACAFRDAKPDFAGIDAVIVGVSRDDARQHAKFRDKYDLNFPLVTDEDGAICEAYGTWVEKNMYGRKYMGIERATFLIDETGLVREVWRKVKVPGHAEAVLAAARSL